MADHHGHDIDHVEQRLPLDAISNPDIRHEWQHFRGFGWDDRRIATRLGIEVATMQQWNLRYRRRGAPSRTRSLAAKRREKVDALRAAGMAPADIAARLGIRPHTVHSDCSHLRLVARREGA